MTPTVLLLPGLYDSGPEHWQSYWERSDPRMLRVRQRDWNAPAREEWVATLDAAVTEHGSDVVLVAHSTACALVAFWARDSGRRVRGALLVGPSDTEAPSYPAGPTGWAPMPLAPIPFPTTVVYSSDDEYVSPARAVQFAKAWGSRIVLVHDAGHLNSASGLGDWPLGRMQLDQLLGA
ncbi:MAG: alpha/beta hydrolase [Gemmatimonadales bacterium]